MKRLAILLLAFSLSAACAGYAEDSPARSADEVRSRGVLRVGTAGDYQPMSYLDPETNTYVGFDAELAEDLAASLGVKIEYVKTSWPTLMEDTLAGKFDLAVCGITVTDEDVSAYALEVLGMLGRPDAAVLADVYHTYRGGGSFDAFRRLSSSTTH